MNILICGCNGKMGQAVLKASQRDKDCSVVAGIDINAKLNYEFPIFESPETVGIDCDVIIDFSNPSVTDRLLKFALESKTPLVLCTTGLSEAQVENVKKASEKIPILYSRNMSLGINLLVEIVKQATKILANDFDIEIIEKHHNQKIDAPSGTALMIAEEISKEMKEPPKYIYDRTTKRESRTKNEIGIHSIRGGTVAGEHEVMFMGDNEILTISHSAGSRDIFALGALKAAKYLVSKGEKGLYTMKDVINNI